MYYPVDCHSAIDDHPPAKAAPSSDELHLVTCGLEDCAPLHMFEGVRDMYILSFVYRGKGYVRDNDRLVSLTKGDIFLTEPAEKVSYYADREMPWSYMWVGFCGSKASDYLSSAGYDHTHRFGHTEHLSMIREPLEQIVTDHSCTQESELRRHTALLQLFTILKNQADASLSFCSRETSFCEQYVKQAQNYIACHYSSDLKISDLADNIGIDRSYLTRLFRETLGLSPQEYLLQYRFTHAARLLSDSSLKIESIAHAVGYDNPSSFSRMFKQVKGMTPSEYRQQLAIPPEQSRRTAPL